ncbi:MAG: glutamine amidotransferase [Myxococcales bacterium]|nr:glutamine amidotransferase [Myxococcales bacterium]
MADKKLLVLNMGPCLIDGRGPYHRLVCEAAGWPLSRTWAIDVYEGAPLPAPHEVLGVVLTGAAAMVTDRADWSENTARWLRGAIESELPIFGICYGHQLVAHALGGRVGPNPRGREMGTVTVSLAASAHGEAPFAGVGSELCVQSSHVESVLEPPREARLLGGNETDPCQAMAIGERCWTVQFHPEWDAAVTGAYIEQRAETLREEGRDPEAMLAALRDSKDGAAILSRFTTTLEHDG